MNITLFVLTAGSFDITPVPLQGASSNTRSKPCIICTKQTSDCYIKH